ncbi:MAG: DUF1579 family protein [Lysobacterales bacterium]
MHKRWMLSLLTLALPLAVTAQDAPPMSAEEQAMMEAYQKAGTPGPEHARLAASVGDYLLSIKTYQAPGAEPMHDVGKARRYMNLAGRVLVEEVDSAMMGQSFAGYGMTGFDNVSGRYWSTWNDSMTTGVMVSDGSCDASGACEFSGTYNDPITRQPISSRMTSKPAGDGVEIFHMYGPGPDGKEMLMMEITYTRQ